MEENNLEENITLEESTPDVEVLKDESKVEFEESAFEKRREENMDVESIPKEEIIVKDDTPWIFFDYSGTLVNTINALARTYTRFLNREFSTEEVKKLYRDYPKMSKFAIARKYKFNIFKMIFGGKSKIEEIRQEEFFRDVKAFPGIPEVLNRLQKIVNAKLAIVTHETEIQDEEQRMKIFQRFGIPILFDAVISDSTNKQEQFDLFIQQNGVQYGMIFGDLQFDLDIGKKHGFHTIGVTWGFSVRDEFTADYIIDDPREILQIVMHLVHQIEQKKLHGDPM